MAYEKTNWVNGETPISAENLNKMEEGIEEAGKTGGILEGTIVAYDGDTIPEGYEEVPNPNIYSTEETFTGKYWINGKKIYSKTIVYSYTETLGGTGKIANYLIPHNIENVELFIDNIARHQNGYKLPIINGSGTNITVGTEVVGVNSTDINLRVINDTWGASTWYFTLEYTKTTD